MISGGPPGYLYATQVNQVWTILVNQLSTSNPRVTYQGLDSMLIHPVGFRLVGALVLGPIQDYCLANGLPDLTVLVGLSQGPGKRVGKPGIDFFCNGVGRGYGRARCVHAGKVVPPTCQRGASTPSQAHTWQTIFQSVQTASARFPVNPPLGLLPPLPRTRSC